MIIAEFVHRLRRRTASACTAQRDTRAHIADMCKHALMPPAGSQRIRELPASTLASGVAGGLQNSPPTDTIVLGFSLPKGSALTAATFALRLEGVSDGAGSGRRNRPREAGLTPPRTLSPSAYASQHTTHASMYCYR